MMCPKCNLHLEVVGPNYHYSDTHLQCPQCDGTFPLAPHRMNYRGFTIIEHTDGDWGMEEHFAAATASALFSGEDRYLQKDLKIHPNTGGKETGWWSHIVSVKEAIDEFWNSVSDPQ